MGVGCVLCVLFCTGTPFLCWIEIFGLGWVGLGWVLFCLYGNPFRVELDWDLGSWVVLLFFFFDLSLCYLLCKKWESV